MFCYIVHVTECLFTLSTTQVRGIARPGPLPFVMVFDIRTTLSYSFSYTEVGTVFFITAVVEVVQ